ncbi:leucyl aminopeptidase [Brevibacterium samyangense]|uniref:Probable cytosol aminopeptidase n=1 Tax=Brevibacterium samyangense TaxID=366888 RepID=A0ABP5EYC0_9MICO
MSSSLLPSASSTAPARAKADVLVVAVSSGDTLTVHGDFTAATSKALVAAAGAVDFSGKANSLARIPAVPGLAASSVLLVGLGDLSPAALLADDPLDLGSAAALEVLRRAAGTALRSLGEGASVALAFPTAEPAAAEAVATGAALRAYRFTEYLSDGESKAPVATIEVLTTKKNAAAVERGAIVAAAVARTRDLVNTPPIDLYPASFADAVSSQAKGRKVKVTVLDEAALVAGGYGGLIGVGQGSARGPRLVKVEYAPRRSAGHLALVGKGITFDSGGISLKPAASMEDMKSDMAGAAAAVQTAFAAHDLGLPVKVTAWLCLAENMPGSSASRPSDVVRIYGGKTVEITNTDAEGRVVMADGLVAAQEEHPDLLVDIATLTGAQVIALGNRVSGVMGTDDARNRVVLAAEVCGEQFWPMPIPEEMLAGFSSNVADLKNAGKRPGGMLAAAAFLREFVESDQEWAHLDIAGPAFNTDGAWGYTPVAGTGVPVRTLLALAESMAAS